MINEDLLLGWLEHNRVSLEHGAIVSTHVSTHELDTKGFYVIERNGNICWFLWRRNYDDHSSYLVAAPKALNDAKQAAQYHFEMSQKPVEKAANCDYKRALEKLKLNCDYRLFYRPPAYEPPDISFERLDCETYLRLGETRKQRVYKALDIYLTGSLSKTDPRRTSCSINDRKEFLADVVEFIAEQELLLKALADSK